MASNHHGSAYHPHHTRSTSTRTPPTVTVIVNKPYETVPLLPRERQRKQTYGLMLRLGPAICIVFLLAMGYQTLQMWTHYMYCPPDPVTRDAMRLVWEREKMEHDVLQHAWAREKRERELERERWRREVEERDRREEEERQKRHMYWDHVQAHTCTTYATREYSAQLMNLPRDWDHRRRLDACRATLLDVHGVSYLPGTCQDMDSGFVIGRWKINQGEPDCTTFWDLYNDKAGVALSLWYRALKCNQGCTSPGSGKKYITRKLMNLPNHGDWKEFCATTPESFNNIRFPGAQECFTSVWGVFGQWEIEDASC